MRLFKRWKFIRRWYPKDFNPHDNVVLKGVKTTKRAKPKDYELCSSFGQDDDVYVYRLSNREFGVLSLNPRYDYAGWSVYRLGSDDVARRRDFESGEEFDVYAPVGEMFLQHDYQIEQTLGPRGLDLAPATIARRLDEYVY